MGYIICLILWSLAGFFNSIMDVMVSRYSRSIFKGIKNKFWYEFFEDNSWDNKYIGENAANGRIQWVIFGFSFNKPVQFTDAWHFAKMMGIFCYGLSILFYYTSTYHLSLIQNSIIGISPEICNILIDILIIGTVRNWTFSIFYEKIFIAKK